jgi:Circularly permutated YpsA SLOG family
MPARLVSGGQSGVDRAALDFAIARGIPYGGWCPHGGWAEDYPAAPGLLAAYPALRETPSADLAQRTQWNVRDSDATLILELPTHDGSAGTDATGAAAVALGRPLLRLGADELRALQSGPAEPESSSVRARVERWFGDLPGVALNVAGPRQSEAFGDAYASAQRVLEILFG